MTRLLHLSDLHFGAHDEGAVQAVLALAQALRPDLVVVTGDLTQRATTAQFRAFGDFRDRMPAARWLVVPGNHDLPWWPPGERVVAPYRRFLAATGQTDTEPDITVGAIRVLAVDTTRWWRHQYGVVGERRTARAAAAPGAGRAAAWTLVACHHPLRLVPPPLNPRPDRRDLPWGHRRALLRWGAAGVDGVLCGHVHVPAWLTDAQDGRPAPGDTRPPWCLQAGSATSWRLPPGQRNSVAVLDCAAATAGPPPLEYTRFDLASGASAFAPVARVSIGHRPGPPGTRRDGAAPPVPVHLQARS